MRKLASLALALMLLLTGASAAAEVALNPPGTLPIVAEPGTQSLSIAIGNRTNIEDFETNYNTLRIERLTGVNIEFLILPANDAQAKMDLLVSSGGELPDLLTIGITDDLRRLNYGKAGILIPLNELYERLGAPFYNRCAEAGLDPEAVLKRVMSPDGNVYGAPFYDWHIPNVLSQRAWINQTWLDRLGLQEPTTTDELVTVLKAFQDGDPNGNGINDEIPMIGNEKAWHSNALSWLMGAYLYSDGFSNYYLPLSVTDGALDVSYDKPAYREFLGYASQLIRDNLLSPLSFTQDGTQFSALLAAQPSTVGIAVAADYLSLMGLPDQYAPLEVLAGPDGVRYTTTFVPPCNAVMGISRDCDNPDLAFLFMNYQLIDKWERITYRWGEEGVDWRRAEEGDMNPYEGIGIKSDIYLYNAIWGTPNNTIWQGACEFPAIVTGDQQMAAPSTPDAPEYMYGKSYMLNLPHSVEFDDLVSKITYTSEEYDRWNDQRTALKSYVAEARTRFAMGELSAENDWDAYMAELNNLDYLGLLAADQVAYDRTMGK
ncbi:MAG: extracellular solute-binding protein [Clostridiales bacterium]|nr:extracellular solute-binding protein [Clostridiales bacterium]